MGISVLQLAAGLDPAEGGTPVAAVATTLALQRAGADTEFAFPYELSRQRATTVFVRTLERAGVPVHAFPEPLPLGSVARRWGISLPLARWVLVTGKRFEVIHVHGALTFPALVGLCAAKFHSRVAVLSTHESLTNFDGSKSGGLKRVAKRSIRWLYLHVFDVVVVASLLEQLDMGGAPDRCVVIPHAVACEAESSTRPGSQGLRIGYLGRLHPKKNVEFLIDSLSVLPPEVSLIIAGGGSPSYLDILKERGYRAGVSARIRWLGFVEAKSKSDFFASIDVLVMPSAFECFGISAVEALYAGVPVVVSDRVGIAPVVEAYDCGRVVAPNVSAVTMALRGLTAEPAILERIALNARSTAQKEFSATAHGERLLDHYRRAVGRPCIRP